ncbi:MAG: hypothetical protein ACXVGA_09955, partial [Mycobacteriaceae bacterium]
PMSDSVTGFCAVCSTTPLLGCWGLPEAVRTIRTWRGGAERAIVGSPDVFRRERMGVNGFDSVR